MNAYELLKAIGEIDDNLILETDQYDKSHSVKKSGIMLGIGLVACAMLCVSGYRIMNHVKPDSKEIPTVSISGNTSVAEGNDKIEINEGYGLNNAKLGGILKQVSREMWTGYFSDDVFITNGNTEYFLSYSDENEVLYGVIETTTDNNDIVEIIVQKSIAADSGYSELKMTDINGVSMAIYGLDAEDNVCGSQYFAVYRNSDNFYTINTNALQIDDFISTLQAIINPV